MACLTTAAHAQSKSPHSNRPAQEAKAVHANGRAKPSSAVRNATGVAAQAIQFAVQNPNASEEDAQATANAIMAGVFSGELGTGQEAPAPHLQGGKPGKMKDHDDYGSH